MLTYLVAILVVPHFFEKTQKAFVFHSIEKRGEFLLQAIKRARKGTKKDSLMHIPGPR
jgi:hypothetical protein